MKNLRRLSLILAACSTGFICRPLSATESEDAILAVLKPVADAAMRGDFAAGIEVMYEPLAQEMGGKQRLIASVATLKKDMDAQNLRIVRQEFVPPFRFVQGEKRRYVIVPTLTELQSPTNLMRARSFQLGVEVSPGTWQFVDGAQVNRPLIDKYFSDFPATEKLPERRQETLPLPIGAR
jgi:hypothetical protein